MRALFLLPLLLAACAEDVAKDKAHATVAEPPPAPAAAPAPAAPAGPELPIDKAKSKVGAVGAKITAQHELAFPEFEGKVRLDGENVAGLAFTVQVASLATEPEKLQNHLKSPDFFDVAAHPTATFTSAEIKPGAGENGATHEVAGDLTLRGVTKRVTFPAKLAVSATEVSGSAEFAINRKDFGIVYPGKPDDLIQDNVVLKIELAAPRG